MPDWWPWLALGVFASHLPFFALRWWRTRAPRFAATTLTFGLLVATYALQLFAPELRIGDRELHEICRRFAWGAAAVSLSLLVTHRIPSKSRHFRSSLDD